MTPERLKALTEHIRSMAVWAAMQDDFAGTQAEAERIYDEWLAAHDAEVEGMRGGGEPV